MKYKVEGESSDGNYLDGQSFDTEQEADTFADTYHDYCKVVE